jgi:hypothetical protein
MSTTVNVRALLGVSEALTDRELLDVWARKVLRLPSGCPQDDIFRAIVCEVENYPAGLSDVDVFLQMSHKYLQADGSHGAMVLSSLIDVDGEIFQQYCAELRHEYHLPEDASFLSLTVARLADALQVSAKDAAELLPAAYRFALFGRSGSTSSDTDVLNFWLLREIDLWASKSLRVEPQTVENFEQAVVREKALCIYLALQPEDLPPEGSSVQLELLELLKRHLDLPETASRIETVLALVGQRFMEELEAVPA